MVEQRISKGFQLSRGQLIAGGVVAAVILLLAAVVLIPQYLAGVECRQCLPAERAKMLTDTRGTFIQLLVALGGAATVYFTWQNYLRTRRESEENMALARETRAAESFIAAVGQLGHERAEARAGGTVALGRLLRKPLPNEDYWPVMDVLTTFVRGRAAKGVKRATAGKPDIDVEAAINILARRGEGVPRPDRKDGDSPIDLSNTDLSNVWFAKGHWDGAYFEGCELREADFSKTSLREANFEGANLWKADFRDATFEETNFNNANLDQALFTAEGAAAAGITRGRRPDFKIV